MNRKYKGIILLIENDINIQLLLKFYFNAAAYSVHSTASAKDALRLLKRITPDLIVCDMFLPAINGFEFRKKISISIEASLIPFIFLTNELDPPLNIEGLSLGADACFAKTIDPRVLIAKSDSLIKKRNIINNLIKYDDLTCMLNKKYLEDRLSKEIERSVRYSRQLSVLMIDIDHFKQINDNFGHLVGDDILKKVSSEILARIRTGDFAGRVGGDEFVIVMPETDKDSCWKTAHRIREVLAAINWKRDNLQVTMSIGVASLPEDGLKLNELLHAADVALYMAKDGGRDNVFLHSRTMLAGKQC